MKPNVRTAVLSALVLAACTEPPGRRPSDSYGSDPRSLVPASLQDLEFQVRAEGHWLVRRLPGASGRGLMLDDVPREVACTAHAPAAPELSRAPAPARGVADKEDSWRAPASGGAQTAPLRAGATDDNEEFAAFLAFLEQRIPSLGDRVDHLDVRDRRMLRVVDETGNPVPGAEALFLDEARDLVVWRATTYGDGRAPYYPRLAALPSLDAETGQPTRLLVQVRRGDTVRRTIWDGRSEELVVTLPEPRAARDPVRLDVVLAIDTTGSMGDEIERIKSSLGAMTAKLRGLDREFDLRYGAVLYRDVTDDYVTRTHPFTDDLEAFERALQSVSANGGGDGPESLNQGLAVAVGGMDWREDAAKVVFLIADAPPHMDYRGDVPYGRSLLAALARGIRIHSVAASGLDAAGTVVLRQIAQFTRGKFVFIEYGGSIRDTAASHGIETAVAANNLDRILFELIRDEIAHWGRGD